MKKFKTIVSLAVAVALVAFLAVGCSSSDEEGSVSGEAASAEKALLAISFGTSHDDTRESTIGAVEQALQAAFPDYEVRRAFTSGIIINILAQRGIEIDDVTAAMERLVADGVKEVIIQPTHVLSGFEYDDLIAEIAPYADRFDSFSVGAPLLISDEDYAEVVASLVEETAGYNSEGVAIAFMGHGTGHKANATYIKLQDVLFDADHNNYFIGTVEAEPTVEEVMALVEQSDATKVVLLPLMVVAGDHAKNDLAGDEEDSWKSVFEAAGYEVECVLKGLGQYPGIQAIYVRHAQEAVAP